MAFSKRGQFTTEYLIVIFIALSLIGTFLTFAFVYYSSYSNGVSSHQVSAAASVIAQEANFVSSQGLGSKITFPITYPTINPLTSYFCNNYIQMSSGIYSSIEQASFNLQGLMPTTPGTYLGYAVYNSSGLVDVGVQGAISFINSSYTFNVDTLSYKLNFYNSSFKVAGNTPFNLSVISPSGTIINTSVGTASSGVAQGFLILNTIYPTLLIEVRPTNANVVASSCFAH